MCVCVCVCVCVYVCLFEHTNVCLYIMWKTIINSCIFTEYDLLSELTLS